MLRYLMAVLAAVLVTVQAVVAAEAGQPLRPAIAIIIDDLGQQLGAGVRAVMLPAPLTYSFLPHTPYARPLATLAHNRRKEVMMHLPMEALDHRPMGEGGLRPGMKRQDFVRVVLDDLASVPHVQGINNHMGSLLTQQKLPMRWLMEEIVRHRPLYFVDSHTSKYSVAREVAVEYHIPSLRRQVFLDHDRDPAAIAYQFRRLLTLARRQGVALAIGHPHAETLAFLEQALPLLKAEGIDVLPVSRLILRAQHYESPQRPPLLARRPADPLAQQAEN
ncbi:MAG: divergent polysaccharide deacetylase family protein [Gammaproteobacteria bacterium]